MGAAKHIEAAGNELTVPITTEADSFWCSRLCTDAARRIGFDGKEIGAIAIAVSELVTNALKFAGSGVLTARRIESPRVGIELSVEDRGPGIRDPAAARIDGYSEGRLLQPEEYAHRTRGIGAGLGAVARLMDEVSIESPPGGGVRVVARKFLPVRSNGDGCARGTTAH
jgi:serine/threonine-protein kinase RsbT